MLKIYGITYCGTIFHVESLRRHWTYRGGDIETPTVTGVILDEPGVKIVIACQKANNAAGTDTVGT